MSLTNDKVSIHARYIVGNSMLADRVVKSGFSNVISVDALAFASGNRADPCVFIGETAPGANYDTIAIIGDEYHLYTFAAGVVTEVAKYLRTSSGWQAYVLNGGEFNPGYVDIVLTSAQVKALKATPITLVAAPGADLAIVPVAVNIVVNYGGTNAFTEAADDLSIGYATGAEIKEIETTGLIDQTNDEWRYITFEHAETFIPEENKAVVVTNLDDEFAGNAGADNTVNIRLYYRTVPTDGYTP